MHVCKNSTLVFYFLLLLVLSCMFSSLSACKSKKQPNVVVIVTDDSGYSDLGCYGGEISTPHLDSLAYNGVRFKNFYNYGKCSPTRAALLTGQYPTTVGAGDLCRVQSETNLQGYKGYLDANYPTLAELLKRGGYHTMMSGKWHLGGEQTDPISYKAPFNPRPTEQAKWPLARGFDYFFGLIHGSSGHWKGWDTRPYYEGKARYNTTKHPNLFYSSDAFTDFALDFVKEVRTKDDKPFFLYMPFTAPHNPLEASKPLVDKYIGIYNSPEEMMQVRQQRFENLKRLGLIDDSWEINNEFVSTLFKSGRFAKHENRKELTLKLATHAAMMEVVDKNVGRVVQQLREMGELDNTIIIYFSDNGADGHGRADIFNVPFHGVKTSLREGGIKSPMIVHWPDGLTHKKGSIVNGAGHVIDILPTCLDVTGIEYKMNNDFSKTIKPVGKSLLPLFQNEKEKLDRKFLFWDLYGQQAVIFEEEWKWYNDENGVDYLFNLKVDGTEKSNVAPHKEKIVKKLKRAYDDFARKSNVLPFEEVKKAQYNNEWNTAERKQAERKRKAKQKKKEEKAKKEMPE